MQLTHVGIQIASVCFSCPAINSNVRFWYHGQTNRAEMASCEYASLVDRQCGHSVGNPGNTQCIPNRDCGKDIRNHLRAFGAGFADSTLKTEAELLLARAGIKLL